MEQLNVENGFSTDANLSLKRDLGSDDICDVKPSYPGLAPPSDTCCFSPYSPSSAYSSTCSMSHSYSYSSFSSENSNNSYNSSTRGSGFTSSAFEYSFARDEIETETETDGLTLTKNYNIKSKDLNVTKDYTQGIEKLEIVSQNYAWGKLATDSIVAKLVKKNKENVNNTNNTNNIKNDFKSNKKNDENTPYAELWMGTHKNGPSKVVSFEDNNNNNVLLSDYLKGDLPYLFKVLSIARALSIQVHPNKSMAEKLHFERPNIYKDSNHKPEMAVALTPFEAMCGFRPLQEIEHFLKFVPEFAAIVGNDVKNELMNAMSVKLNEKKKENENEKMSEEESKLLKKVFEKVMNAKKEDVEIQIKSLVKRLSDSQNIQKIPKYVPNSDTKSEEKSDSNNEKDGFERNIEMTELILRLNSEFPNDVGIFAAFMLNCFRLQENEAVFLCANLPHAYLSGDCIECMACSDNVVRAGLTPKLRDTKVLCDIVEYVAAKPKIMFGKHENKYSVRYAPNVKEFGLIVTTLNANQREKMEIIDSNENKNEENENGNDVASILLVYEGNGKINNINVNEGDCLLVPKHVGTLDIEAAQNCGMKVARCYAP